LQRFKAFYFNKFNSKLLNDSLVYTLFNFTEKAIPFLILPFLTRYLSKEEVGIYVLYQAIIQVLLPIITFGLDSAIFLNFYKVTRQEFKEYFTNVTVFFLPFFALFLLLSFFVPESVFDQLDFPQSWIWILVIMVFFRFFTQLRQHIWRIQFKTKHYSYLTIGIAILTNLVGLLLVFNFSLGWEGMILGHLTGYSVFALISIYTFIQERLLSLSVKFNRQYIKDSILVGFPLALHRMGLWLGNTANRIIVTAILGATATASYGIAATFAVMVTMVEDAFTKAFVPYLFERLKNINEEIKYRIVKLTYLVYVALAAVTSAFFFVGYFGVGIIFGEEYLNTKEFLFPLMLAAMIKGFYKLHVNYIMFTKRTIKVTQITITTGLLNLLLAYHLTMNFGIIGTAYSLVIVNVIQYILAFYVGHRLIPMPWIGKKVKIS